MVLKEIVLSDPQEDFVTSVEERNLFLAGTGSGKSHVGGLIAADFIKNAPHVNGFIGANTYKQISQSTLARIFKVWETEFGWKMNRDYICNKIPPKDWIIYGQQLESYDKTISFPNGCLLFTGSLDNYKSLDGMEFGWAILDETKDTAEEAVKEVIINRLRQTGIWINDNYDFFFNLQDAIDSGLSYRGWNPLYILTSPAKVDWINDWFEIGDHSEIEEIHKKIFSETDYFSRTRNGKHVVISSTYHNMPNLPANYIENLKRDYGNNQNRVAMLIYGSPVAKTGGEYFSAFDRTKHIKELPYDKEKALHISLDFNVVPYITQLVFQVHLNEGKYTVNFFDEICLESPRNNTEALCKQFAATYLEDKDSRGLFYTGDASGKSGSTQSTEHNYQTLERVLRKWISNSSDRTQRKNPSLQKSRDFINKCFSGGFDNIEIVISPKCKRLITDLEFLKEGADGGYIKQHAKDPQTGQTYEKYGHLADAFKYALISTFEQYYDR